MEEPITFFRHGTIFGFLLALCIAFMVFLSFYLHYVSYECESLIMTQKGGEAIDKHKAEQVCNTWQVSWSKTLRIYSFVQ
jgi:hypothetical protein